MAGRPLRRVQRACPGRATLSGPVRSGGDGRAWRKARRVGSEDHGEEGSDPGFYWQDEPHIDGWIIVDAQIWDSDATRNFDALLDAIADEVNVEGGKFHAVCWSANSAGIFGLITRHAERFHSITGMAGNPGRLSSADIDALQTVKVQFVVGENDPYWQRSARDAHEKFTAGGIDSVFEIVPNGKHVMTNLIGAPFIQKLE